MYEADKYLDTVKKIHMIGIGGSGMCPLAELLHAKGYEITGSDVNVTDTLKRVEALGIKVIIGQKAENIKTVAPELIIYSGAIMKDNPERVAAEQSGIPTFERSKLLGAYSRLFGKCVGVCGTHGKTTTTSLLTQMLIECGMEPNAVIGGKLPLTGTNGIIGSSDTFICEACEFSNTYHEISPSCVVLLNVDNDHLEFFKTMDGLKRSFAHFCELSSDAVIYNGDDVPTTDVISMVKDKRFITFGMTDKSDWYPENIVIDDAAPSFDVMHKGKFLGRAKLSIHGKFNILNALAAFAAADYCGADMKEIIASAGNFRGAGRRFEILGKVDKGGIITIADDYAHHPTELEVTLRAIKEMSYKRIIVVFQPFTYSRTAMLLDDFARVLSIADKVLLTEIMASREKNTYGISSSDLAAKLSSCEIYDSFEAIADAAIDCAQPGDLIITFGCGDIYKAAKIMVEKYGIKD